MKRKHLSIFLKFIRTKWRRRRCSRDWSSFGSIQGVGCGWVNCQRKQMNEITVVNFPIIVEKLNKLQQRNRIF